MMSLKDERLGNEENNMKFRSKSNGYCTLNISSACRLKWGVRESSPELVYYYRTRIG